MEGHDDNGSGSEAEKLEQQSVPVVSIVGRTLTPPPAAKPTLDDLIREQRATRMLLNDHLAESRDDRRDINRKFEAIMELLKEALSR